jgi:hypothetical protein
MHERYDDQDVVSELSSPRERVASIHESIPEDDGYSSSFDEESAALVRHRQHSPRHNTSYIQDEQGQGFEPEVATSVQSTVSVETDRSREQPPRDSVEYVPEVEYSSFANTASGPGIIESPHPSSEDMNRSAELHLQREQELLKALAEKDKELERLRKQLEEQQLQARELQAERERQLLAERERASREEEQQLLRAQQLAQQQAALARQQQQTEEQVEDEIDEELSREDAEYSTGKRELQSEVYDDSFASSSGLYPDMVAAASAARDDAGKALTAGHLEREEPGGYESDTFASSEVMGWSGGLSELVLGVHNSDCQLNKRCVAQGGHAESIADVASVTEEIRSEDGSTQEEDHGPLLQSSTSPEDALNASMSIEALEGSISHADALLAIDRHKEADAERERHALAAAEDAFVDSVQNAMADGSAGPLHLRMTDSRYSMSGMNTEPRCSCGY